MGGICAKENSVGTEGETQVYLDDLNKPLGSPHSDTEDPSMLVRYKDFVFSDGYADRFVGVWGSRKVWIRKLTRKTMDEAQRTGFETEIRSYLSLSHANVSSILGARVNPPGFCYITNFYDKGTLDRLLKDDRTNITPALKVKILIQIAEGVNYLHTRDPVVRHEDLKTSAVGISGDWTAIVCDYGFSVLKAQSRMQSLNHESAVSTDPCIFLGQPLTTKSDVYSFSMVMWEIWSRTLPFAGTNQLRIAHDAARGVRPPLPQGCPEGFCELMTACWDNDSTKRPSFEEIAATLKQIKA